MTVKQKSEYSSNRFLSESFISNQLAQFPMQQLSQPQEPTPQQLSSIQQPSHHTPQLPAQLNPSAASAHQPVLPIVEHSTLTKILAILAVSIYVLIIISVAL